MRNFLIILLFIVVTALLNTLIGGLAGYALASLFFAIILFTGKGDILIAGYNTASKEEKEKCNIKRLRFLVGSIFILLACLIALRDMDIMGRGLFVVSTIILVIVTLILANTWAMKK